VTKDLLAEHQDAKFDKASATLYLPKVGDLGKPTSLAALGQQVAQRTGVSQVTLQKTGKEIEVWGAINPRGKVSKIPDPKAKAIEAIKAKAATFGNFKCVECAEALKAILVAAGVPGKVVRLTNKPPNKNGYVYCVSKNMNVSDTNFHVGVDVDGIVYDNHHPGGVARGAWMDDFAHMGFPQGGPGGFTMTEEAF
jgi:hypothetical protein